MPDAAANAPPGGMEHAPATQATVLADHPKILDTARLVVGDRVLTLSGLVGLGGAPADGLQNYIIGEGDRLTCQGHPNGQFTCLLPDGVDVAAAALLNGAARTTDNAPKQYKQQEEQAIAARRGLWASLPPPPVALGSPVVLDTATLAVGSDRYVLAGVQGYAAPYAGQLQGYIAANGGALTCQENGAGDSFVCLLPDGTDISTVTLLNGAARVAPDAPDSYRRQQADAMTNRRGIWQDVAPDVVAAFIAAPPPDPAYVLVPEDQGDGIAYIGGLPAAVIGGETVFLTFAGAAGWGYYDHGHDWHGAPERYRAHLERFHPQGRNLRGMHEAAYRREGVDHLSRQDAAGGAFGHDAHGFAHQEPAHFGSVRPEPTGARSQQASDFGHSRMQGENRTSGPGSGDRPASPTGFHPTAKSYGSRPGGMPTGLGHSNFASTGFRSPVSQPGFGQPAFNSAARMQSGFHPGATPTGSTGFGGFHALPGGMMPSAHTAMPSVARSQPAAKPCLPKHC